MKNIKLFRLEEYVLVDEEEYDYFPNSDGLKPL